MDVVVGVVFEECRMCVISLKDSVIIQCHCFDWLSFLLFQRVGCFLLSSRHSL